MIRFVLLWAGLTAMAYLFIYIATKTERQSIRKQVGRVAIAALVALVFIAALFSINHVSGV